MKFNFISGAAALLALLLCFPMEARKKDKTASEFTYGVEVPPTKVLLLYPEGQDVDKGIVEDGVAVTLGPGESNGITTGQEIAPNGNISKIGNEACLKLYIPKNCNGQMIIVCPGGGYALVSSQNEGTRVAKWCLQHGIAACVVHYRMPQQHNIIPLRDVQNAFRYCRAHQQEWGVKQIGVMGFSAGGHLAGSATVLYKDQVTKPDFSLLIYPVITMEPGVTHKGTMNNLTGGDPKLMEYYSLENHVDKNTPKTLLMLCQDDKTVPAENSIRFYSKMVENGVQGELHIFTKGGHGWGFTSDEWTDNDKFGAAQRADFYAILERFLKDRASEITE